jgi:hypothetical protein
VVALVNAATLGDAIHEEVHRPSTLMTDWLNLYTPVGSEYVGHHRVDHERKEYVRDGWITTDTVEGSSASTVAPAVVPRCSRRSGRRRGLLSP